MTDATRPGWWRGRWVAWVVAVAAAVVAVLSLRQGIVPTGDAVSYWSAATQVRDLHPLTTRLVPGFSHVDLTRFVDGGGRIPVADFPFGYPLVAGLGGFLAGVKPAMAAVTVAAAAAVGYLVVAGPSPARSAGSVLVRAGVGVGVVGWPVSRALHGAALPEPLFGALVLATAVAMLRARRGPDAGWWPAVWAGAAGLVRFQGLAVGAVVVVDELRRHRDVRRGLRVAIVALGPPLANVAFTAVVGSGRALGWYSLGRDDLELAAASITEWFTRAAPSIGEVFRPAAGTSWWTVAVLAAWCMLAAVAAVAWWRGRGLPEVLAVPLVLALAQLVMTVATMATADALVVLEARIMWPLGVLTLAGLAWAADELAPRFAPWAAVVAGLWFVSSTAAWTWADTSSAASPPAVAVVRDSGARLVVSNSADPLHWATGVPAAPLPPAVDAQSGRRRDQDAAYDVLPCDLERGGGIAVIDRSSYLPAADALERLDALVALDRLIAHDAPSTRWYEPGPLACP